MSLFPSIVSIAGHFSVLVIDLALVFVLTRLVVRRKRVDLLAGLDAAGRPLVAAMLRRADQCQRAFRPACVPVEGRSLLLVLVSLVTLRILVSGLITALT